jgi:antirestriction protein ArdC
MSAGPQSPFNPVTHHRYRGVSVLILAMNPKAFFTGDSRWVKAEDRTRTVHILKHFAVFYASQVDGIPPYVPPAVEEAPWRRPDAAQIILDNSHVPVRTGGELSHATGHPSRPDREMGKKYGSAGYAMEELRAELSSAFIAGELGIPADIPNHASYIQSWLKLLKDRRNLQGRGRRPEDRRYGAGVSPGFSG